MAAVHIRIGHKDDLVISQFADVKVIAIPLGKSAAKGVDHGLDLPVGKDFVHGSLFHI